MLYVLGLKIGLDIGLDVEEPYRYHAVLAGGHHSTRPRRQSSA